MRPPKREKRDNMKLCTECEKYKTCAELCPEAEEHVNQDSVYLRESYMSEKTENEIWGAYDENHS